MSSRLKGKFYRTAVRPTILYVSECWPIKKQQEHKIKVAEMRILRWTSGLTLRDKVRNETIRSDLNVAPIDEKIREGQMEVDRKMTESKNLDLKMNSKHNVADMEQSVQHLLKFVEEGGKSILGKADIESDNSQEELVAHIQEFHRLFRSLAAQFHDCKYVTPSENGNHPAPRSSVSESSSSLSSDSDSEYAVTSVNDIADSDLSLKVAANGNYEELLGRVAKYEEELNYLKVKFHLSGIEIDRMKSELEKASTRLKSAQEEIDASDAKLETERMEVVHLKEKIAELEACASESNRRTANLIVELEESRASRQVSDKEIVMLNAKLGSETRQVSELKEEIAKYKAALSETQTNFSKAKAQMQSEMHQLTENCATLNARLVEWQLQGKCLEDKLKRHEDAEMEMKSLLENKEYAMQSEINNLKEQLGNKGNHVEVLNKDFDNLKLKYDMLMAEKDGFKAKIDELFAEVSSRDDTVKQMAEQLNQSNADNVKNVAISEEERKVIRKLEVRVDELEKDVGMQKSMVLNGAEEKREAIRQLCFTLDYYRNEYRELREAFRSNKRYALMAA
ncbi:protein NETWORKED 4A-like [Rutidosis leptorrhynchoides]|uniref:protein NETWORKED 4A-like n=1 Tax=Rutidosis leptorrhynchoides TaxID=125765 RepID=UPI003A998B9A